MTSGTGIMGRKALSPETGGSLAVDGESKLEVVNSRGEGSFILDNGIIRYISKAGQAILNAFGFGNNETSEFSEEDIGGFKSKATERPIIQSSGHQDGFKADSDDQLYNESIIPDSVRDENDNYNGSGYHTVTPDAEPDVKTTGKTRTEHQEINTSTTTASEAKPFSEEHETLDSPKGSHGPLLNESSPNPPQTSETRQPPTFEEDENGAKPTMTTEKGNDRGFLEVLSQHTPAPQLLTTLEPVNSVTSLHDTYPVDLLYANFHKILPLMEVQVPQNKYYYPSSPQKTHAGTSEGTLGLLDLLNQTPSALIDVNILDNFLANLEKTPPSSTDKNEGSISVVEEHGSFERTPVHHGYTEKSKETSILSGISTMNLGSTKGTTPPPPPRGQTKKGTKFTKVPLFTTDTHILNDFLESYLQQVTQESPKSSAPQTTPSHAPSSQQSSSTPQFPHSHESTASTVSDPQSDVSETLSESRIKTFTSSPSPYAPVGLNAFSLNSATTKDTSSKHKAPAPSVITTTTPVPRTSGLWRLPPVTVPAFFMNSNHPSDEDESAFTFTANHPLYFKTTTRKPFVRPSTTKGTKQPYGEPHSKVTKQPSGKPFSQVTSEPVRTSTLSADDALFNFNTVGRRPVIREPATDKATFLQLSNTNANRNSSPSQTEELFKDITRNYPPYTRSTTQQPFKRPSSNLSTTNHKTVDQDNKMYVTRRPVKEKITTSTKSDLMRFKITTGSPVTRHSVTKLPSRTQIPNSNTLKEELTNMFGFYFDEYGAANDAHISTNSRTTEFPLDRTSERSNLTFVYTRPTSYEQKLKNKTRNHLDYLLNQTQLLESYTTTKYKLLSPTEKTPNNKASTVANNRKSPTIASDRESAFVNSETTTTLSLQTATQSNVTFDIIDALQEETMKILEVPSQGVRANEGPTNPVLDKEASGMSSEVIPTQIPPETTTPNEQWEAFVSNILHTTVLSYKPSTKLDDVENKVPMSNDTFQLWRGTTVRPSLVPPGASDSKYRTTTALPGGAQKPKPLTLPTSDFDSTANIPSMTNTDVFNKRIGSVSYDINEEFDMPYKIAEDNEIDESKWEIENSSQNSIDSRPLYPESPTSESSVKLPEAYWVTDLVHSPAFPSQITKWGFTSAPAIKDLSNSFDIGELATSSNSEEMTILDAFEKSTGQFFQTFSPAGDSQTDHEELSSWSPHSERDSSARPSFYPISKLKTLIEANSILGQSSVGKGGISSEQEENSYATSPTVLTTAKKQSNINSQMQKLSFLFSVAQSTLPEGSSDYDILKYLIGIVEQPSSTPASNNNPDVVNIPVRPIEAEVNLKPETTIEYPLLPASSVVIRPTQAKISVSPTTVVTYTTLVSLQPTEAEINIRPTPVDYTTLMTDIPISSEFDIRPTLVAFSEDGEPQASLPVTTDTTLISVQPNEALISVVSASTSTHATSLSLPFHQAMVSAITHEVVTYVTSTPIASSEALTTNPASSETLPYETVLPDEAANNIIPSESSPYTNLVPMRPSEAAIGIELSEFVTSTTLMEKDPNGASTVITPSNLITYTTSSAMKTNNTEVISVPATGGSHLSPLSIIPEETEADLPVSDFVTYATTVPLTPDEAGIKVSPTEYVTYITSVLLTTNNALIGVVPTEYVTYTTIVPIIPSKAKVSVTPNEYVTYTTSVLIVPDDVVVGVKPSEFSTYTTKVPVVPHDVGIGITPSQFITYTTSVSIVPGEVEVNIQPSKFVPYTTMVSVVPDKFEVSVVAGEVVHYTTEILVKPTYAEVTLEPTIMATYTTLVSLTPEKAEITVRPNTYETYSTVSTVSIPFHPSTAEMSVHATFVSYPAPAQTQSPSAVTGTKIIQTPDTDQSAMSSKSLHPVDYHDANDLTLVTHTTTFVSYDVIHSSSVASITSFTDTILGGTIETKYSIVPMNSVSSVQPSILTFLEEMDIDVNEVDAGTFPEQTEIKVESSFISTISYYPEVTITQEPVTSEWSSLDFYPTPSYGEELSSLPEVSLVSSYSSVYSSITNDGWPVYIENFSRLTTFTPSFTLIEDLTSSTIHLVTPTFTYFEYSSVMVGQGQPQDPQYNDLTSEVWTGEAGAQVPPLSAFQSYDPPIHTNLNSQASQISQSNFTASAADVIVRPQEVGVTISPTTTVTIQQSSTDANILPPRNFTTVASLTDTGILSSETTSSGLGTYPVQPLKNIHPATSTVYVSSASIAVYPSQALISVRPSTVYTNPSLVSEIAPHRTQVVVIPLKINISRPEVDNMLSPDSLSTNTVNKSDITDVNKYTTSSLLTVESPTPWPNLSTYQSVGETDVSDWFSSVNESTNEITTSLSTTQLQLSTPLSRPPLPVISQSPPAPVVTSSDWIEQQIADFLATSTILPLQPTTAPSVYIPQPSYEGLPPWFVELISRPTTTTTTTTTTTERPSYLHNTSTIIKTLISQIKILRRYASSRPSLLNVLLGPNNPLSTILRGVLKAAKDDSEEALKLLESINASQAASENDEYTLDGSIAPDIVGSGQLPTDGVTTPPSSSLSPLAESLAPGFGATGSLTSGAMAVVPAINTTIEAPVTIPSTLTSNPLDPLLLPKFPTIFVTLPPEDVSPASDGGADIKLPSTILDSAHPPATIPASPQISPPDSSFFLSPEDGTSPFAPPLSSIPPFHNDTEPQTSSNSPLYVVYPTESHSQTIFSDDTLIQPGTKPSTATLSSVLEEYEQAQLTYLIHQVLMNYIDQENLTKNETGGVQPGNESASYPDAEDYSDSFTSLIKADTEKGNQTTGNKTNVNIMLEWADNVATALVDGSHNFANITISAPSNSKPEALIDLLKETLKVVLPRNGSFGEIRERDLPDPAILQKVLYQLTGNALFDPSQTTSTTQFENWLGSADDVDFPGAVSMDDHLYEGNQFYLNIIPETNFPPLLVKPPKRSPIHTPPVSLKKWTSTLIPSTSSQAYSIFSEPNLNSERLQTVVANHYEEVAALSKKGLNSAIREPSASYYKDSISSTPLVVTLPKTESHSLPSSQAQVSAQGGVLHSKHSATKTATKSQSTLPQNLFDFPPRPTAAELVELNSKFVSTPVSLESSLVSSVAQWFGSNIQSPSEYPGSSHPPSAWASLTAEAHPKTGGQETFSDFKAKHDEDAQHFGFRPSEARITMWPEIVTTITTAPTSFHHLSTTTVIYRPTVTHLDVSDSSTIYSIVTVTVTPTQTVEASAVTTTVTTVTIKATATQNSTVPTTTDWISPTPEKNKYEVSMEEDFTTEGNLWWGTTTSEPTTSLSLEDFPDFYSGSPHVRPIFTPISPTVETELGNLVSQVAILQELVLHLINDSVSSDPVFVTAQDFLDTYTGSDTIDGTNLTTVSPVIPFNDNMTNISATEINFAKLKETYMEGIAYKPPAFTPGTPQSPVEAVSSPFLVATTPSSLTDLSNTTRIQSPFLFHPTTPENSLSFTHHLENVLPVTNLPLSSSNAIKESHESMITSVVKQMNKVTETLGIESSLNTTSDIIVDDGANGINSTKEQGLSNLAVKLLEEAILILKEKYKAQKEESSSGPMETILEMQSILTTVVDNFNKTIMDNHTLSHFHSIHNPSDGPSSSVHPQTSSTVTGNPLNIPDISSITASNVSLEIQSMLSSAGSPLNHETGTAVDEKNLAKDVASTEMPLAATQTSSIQSSNTTAVQGTFQDLLSQVSIVPQAVMSTASILPQSLTSPASAAPGEVASQDSITSQTVTSPVTIAPQDVTSPDSVAFQTWTSPYPDVPQGVTPQTSAAPQLVTSSDSVALLPMTTPDLVELLTVTDRVAPQDLTSQSSFGSQKVTSPASVAPQRLTSPNPAGVSFSSHPNNEETPNTPIPPGYSTTAASPSPEYVEGGILSNLGGSETTPRPSSTIPSSQPEGGFRPVGPLPIFQPLPPDQYLGGTSPVVARPLPMGLGNLGDRLSFMNGPQLPSLTTPMAADKPQSFSYFDLFRIQPTPGMPGIPLPGAVYPVRGAGNPPLATPMSGQEGYPPPSYPGLAYPSHQGSSAMNTPLFPTRKPGVRPLQGLNPPRVMEDNTSGNLQSGVYRCGGVGASVVSNFVNPSYPLPDRGRGVCNFRLFVTDPQVCQVRVDFVDTAMLLPVEGRCRDQQLRVGGTVQLPGVASFCGRNTDQHFYVEVSPHIPGKQRWLDLTVVTAAHTHMYRYGLWVTQVTCGGSDPLQAPSGCLQFFLGTSDIVKSFNFEGQQYLREQDYRICLRVSPQACDVVFKAVESDFGLQKLNSRFVPYDRAGAGSRACVRDYLFIPGMTGGVPVAGEGEEAGNNPGLKGPGRVCGGKFSYIHGDAFSRPVTGKVSGEIFTIYFKSGSPKVYNSITHGPGFRLSYVQRSLCPVLSTGQSGGSASADHEGSLTDVTYGTLRDSDPFIDEYYDDDAFDFPISGPYAFRASSLASKPSDTQPPSVIPSFHKVHDQPSMELPSLTHRQRQNGKYPPHYLSKFEGSLGSRLVPLPLDEAHRILQGSPNDPQTYSLKAAQNLAVSVSTEASKEDFQNPGGETTLPALFGYLTDGGKSTTTLRPNILRRIDAILSETLQETLPGVGHSLGSLLDLPGAGQRNSDSVDEADNYNSLLQSINSINETAKQNETSFAGRNVSGDSSQRYSGNGVSGQGIFAPLRHLGKLRSHLKPYVQKVGSDGLSDSFIISLMSADNESLKNNDTWSASEEFSKLKEFLSSQRDGISTEQSDFASGFQQRRGQPDNLTLWGAATNEEMMTAPESLSERHDVMSADESFPASDSLERIGRPNGSNSEEEVPTLYPERADKGLSTPAGGLLGRLNTMIKDQNYFLSDFQERMGEHESSSADGDLLISYPPEEVITSSTKDLFKSVPVSPNQDVSTNIPITSTEMETVEGNSSIQITQSNTNILSSDNKDLPEKSFVELTFIGTKTPTSEEEPVVVSPTLAPFTRAKAAEGPLAPPTTSDLNKVVESTQVSVFVADEVESSTQEPSNENMTYQSGVLEGVDGTKNGMSLQSGVSALGRTQNVSHNFQISPHRSPNESEDATSPSVQVDNRWAGFRRIETDRTSTKKEVGKKGNQPNKNWASLVTWFPLLDEFFHVTEDEEKARLVTWSSVEPTKSIDNNRLDRHLDKTS